MGVIEIKNLRPIGRIEIENLGTIVPIEINEAQARELAIEIKNLRPMGVIEIKNLSTMVDIEIKNCCQLATSRSTRGGPACWRCRVVENLAPIGAIEIENLSPIGDIEINESQARELAPLAPEEQREVWKEAALVIPEETKP